MPPKGGHVPPRWLTGRIVWMEEEMGFQFCDEHRVWEKAVGGKTVIVDRSMIGTILSLGCFQRAVVNTINKALKEKS